MADTPCVYRDPDIDTIISDMGGIKAKKFTYKFTSATHLNAGQTMSFSAPSGLNNANVYGGVLGFTGGYDLRYAQFYGGSIYISANTSSDIPANTQLQGVMFYI